ncbi:nucleotidyltransferase domain-containing protein [Segatella copri]|jgi:nucleotidyltransferase domain protein|uniref:nucleotidyltransferase domain-containing protein n=2 Tax=Segatella copri TaxID=165179 RepID=UPI001C3879B8|nr:nucleotidyltransferase domain-containing protein [Segatella copri]
MDREHALMIVRCYKEAILPLVSDAKVYLYGSCSRNEARKDSDIDVAVVIPKLQDDWLDTTSSLWLATLDINTSIEPVLIEECNPSPLYEDILRNGIAV